MGLVLKHVRIFGGPFLGEDGFSTLNYDLFQQGNFFRVGGSLINGKDQTSTLKIDQYSVEK